jgi:hypothetical protein
VNRETSREFASLAIESLKRGAELIDRGPKTPGEWAELANTPALSEREREVILRRLAGHLLAHGLDPELVLRLMEAYDTACNWPSLGLDRVAELVGWVVERETEKLRGGRS